MSSMAPSIGVRTALLDEVAGKEVGPFDLLVALGNNGYSDTDIKQALSELLHEGKIELTSHRMLKPSAKNDAA